MNLQFKISVAISATLMSACMCAALPASADIKDDDSGPVDVPIQDSNEMYWQYFGRGGGHCNLKPLPAVKYPYGRFELVQMSYRSRQYTQHVYLSPRFVCVDEFPPTRAILAAHNIDGGYFKPQTTFLKEGKGWTRLSLSEAQTIWGKPRRNDDFYTFDIANIHHGEKNIFHLDCKFDKQSIIKAYRARGIGIGAGEWIDSNGLQPNNIATTAAIKIIKAKSREENSSNMHVRTGNTSDSTIYICTKDGSGWLEFRFKSNSSDRKQDKLWFKDLRLLSKKRSDGSEVFSKADFAICSKLFGVPRQSRAGFFTFDIACTNGSEPDIYHLDLVFDGDAKVIGSRLRGPGANGLEFLGSDPHQ